MKPHLLYIAFWYPPSRASGVYRALATSREFAAAGWDVTVATCTSEFLEDEVGSIDDSLLAETPAGVDIVRVPFTFDLEADLDVRSLSWWSANLPSLWRVIYERTAPLRTTIATIRGNAPEAFQLSDQYVTWIDPLVKAGIEIDANHEIDHILATGNPYSSFEAARVLAGVIGTRFSVDYRDPWTIDVFTGTTEFTDRATLAAERQIVEQAEFCFHVNDAIADAYRDLYPAQAHKQVVVQNGFDAHSIPTRVRPASPPLRFGILGTVNDRWPIEAIFKAWNSCRRELPAESDLVMAGHLGYFARSEDLLEAYLPGEETSFRYVGPIRKADVADFYDAVDVVILPVPGGPMVTSGKVFEALAIGKPIVCVQAGGGGARILLEQHPLAIGAEPNAQSVRTALLNAARMALDLDPEVAAQVRADGARYERHVAMEPMIQAVAGTLQVDRRDERHIHG